MVNERLLEKVLCAWKLCEQEENSTTFYHVREQGPSHGLYKCIDCPGEGEEVCKDYRVLSR